MAFDELGRHVAALGGVHRVDGRPLQPLGDAAVRELEALVGGPVPAAFRWWLTTYGDGIDFVEPVVYDTSDGFDVLIGTFMTVAEIRQTVDDLEGALVARRLPFNDDASGNYLVIDTAGPVYWHIHDAYTDRNAVHVADSFEQFVRMLRVGD